MGSKTFLESCVKNFIIEYILIPKTFSVLYFHIYFFAFKIIVGICNKETTEKNRNNITCNNTYSIVVWNTWLSNWLLASALFLYIQQPFPPISGSCKFQWYVTMWCSIFIILRTFLYFLSFIGWSHFWNNFGFKDINIEVQRWFMFKKYENWSCIYQVRNEQSMKR